VHHLRNQLIIQWVFFACVIQVGRHAQVKTATPLGQSVILSRRQGQSQLQPECLCTNRYPSSVPPCPIYPTKISRASQDRLGSKC